MFDNWDDVEYLTNFHDETATVTRTSAGAVLTLEDGFTRTYPTMDRAINAAYRFGFIF